MPLGIEWFDLKFPPINLYSYPNIGVMIVTVPTDPWEVQIGGNHYKDDKIQPTQFCMANKTPFIESCVIKRMCRHNKPTGKGKEDLLKAKHEIDMAIDFYYGDKSNAK